MIRRAPVRAGLKNIAIACLTCVLAIPLAFLVTLLTFPFWRWLEKVSSIESFGHHGPAAWCYQAVYAVLVLIATINWWRRRGTKKQRGAVDDQQ